MTSQDNSCENITRPHRTAWELACGLMVSSVVTPYLTTLSATCIKAVTANPDHRLAAAFILLPPLAGVGYYAFEKTSKSMARTRANKIYNTPRIIKQL